MSIKDGDFEFKLKVPIDYSFNGTTQKAEMVMLFEPGMEHIKQKLKLKQLITVSQMELAKGFGDLEELKEQYGDEIKKFQDDTENIESGADVMFQAIQAGLEGSNKIEMGDFIGTFEKMILKPARKPIAKVDGKVVMTSVLWNNLNTEDAYNMAARWCAFFVMPSVEGMRTTSEPQPELDTELTVA